MMFSHTLPHQADKIIQLPTSLFLCVQAPEFTQNYAGPTNRISSMPHYVMPMHYIQISNDLVVMTFRTFSFKELN